MPIETDERLANLEFTSLVKESLLFPTQGIKDAFPVKATSYCDLTHPILTPSLSKVRWKYLDPISFVFVISLNIMPTA